MYYISQTCCQVTSCQVESLVIDLQIKSSLKPMISKWANQTRVNKSDISPYHGHYIIIMLHLSPSVCLPLMAILLILLTITEFML